MKYSYSILSVIVIVSMMLGAVFGAWFGITMELIMTGLWLIANLCASVTSDGIDRSQEAPESRETEAGLDHEHHTHRDTDEPRAEYRTNQNPRT